MAAEPARSIRPRSFLEHGAGFVVLLLSTGAILPLWRLRGGDVQEAGLASQLQVSGDSVQQQVWLAIFILVAGLVAWHGRAVFDTASRGTLLWLICGYAVVSTGWSSAPSLTLRRSVLLLAATAFGVYLATRYSPTQLADLLAWVLAALALLSFLTVFVAPAYGLEHGFHEGAWRGVFAQKNRLGLAMVLGTTVWLMRLLYGRGRPIVNLVWLGLLAVVLVRSDSKSSLAVLATMVALLVLVRVMQGGSILVGVVLIGVGVVVPAVAVWVLRNYESVLAGIGRDPTLTGRTDYWAQAWLAIERRPLLGHGYAAFWRGSDGPSADFVVAIGENPTHAHNGLLDLWLILGLVGVLLFLGSLGLNLLRAAARLADRPEIGGALPFVFLAFLVATNLTESDIMVYNSLVWMLYAAFTFQLAPTRGSFTTAMAFDRTIPGVREETGPPRRGSLLSAGRGDLSPDVNVPVAG